MKERISVIIPVYNEERYIGRCLESLKRYPPKNLLEVIVVDNASTDRTVSIAASFPFVRVVRESEKGVTYARQKGFLESQGEILAYLDADTFIDAAWGAALNEKFSNDTELVCLSGPYSYYDVNVFVRALVKAYWLCARLIYPFIGYMAVGGNCAIRRTALGRIGGFDTTIAFYGDDTDTARRLHDVGRVTFTSSFTLFSSGRRFVGEGFFLTGWRYTLNFFSEIFFKKPFTREYKDIR